MVATLFTIVIGAAAFYNDVFIPAKKIITPDDYWVCEQDNNIRGIILKDVSYTKGIPLRIVTGVGRTRVRLLTDTPRVLSDDRFCYDQGLGMANNFCALTYRVNNQGLLVIDADIYDTTGKLIGIIEQNKFMLNVDCQLTWNMDKTAFEVIDLKNNPVFTIEYRPPDTLALQGYFYNKTGFVFLSSRVIGTLELNHPKIYEEISNYLHPLFKYTGQDWFGQRVDSIADYNPNPSPFDLNPEFWKILPNKNQDSNDTADKSTPEPSP